MLPVLRHMVFRSSFQDWCGDRTHYPREVVEAALAHVIENKAAAAYRRGTPLENRCEQMRTWATYCDTPPVSSRVIAARRLLDIDQRRARRAVAV